MLSGNSELPGAAIPAGEGHGQGCRMTLDMVHAGPSTGEGRKIPVRMLCTFVSLSFNKMAAKNAGEEEFKCIDLNFSSMLPPQNHRQVDGNKSHSVAETINPVLCQSHCLW